jgi:type VI secretion system protein ImpK
MNEQTARLVYPVFRHGLRLKQRLRFGQLDLRAEQAELRRLVKAADGATSRPGAGEPADDFLGVGYPLACWLDETFILDPSSPWRSAWREESIEFALYRSRDRAEKFWDQTRLAERRADPGALEVFYLCLMLGFRGRLRESPGELRDARERIEGQLGRGRAGDWAGKPAELPVPPPTAGLLLRARERLRWMLLAWALLGGGAIFLAVFSAVRTFAG